MKAEYHSPQKIDSAALALRELALSEAEYSCDPKSHYQGSRGSFGFVWFQKRRKEPQSGSCGVGSSAVRFLAVQETVRFYECDSCAT